MRESILKPNFTYCMPRGWIVGVASGLCLSVCLACGAQAVSEKALPDAPGVVAYSSSAVVAERSEPPLFELDARAREAGRVSAPVPVEASRTQRFIEVGQPVPALRTQDMVEMGFRDAFSPVAIFGWFTGAGYDQLLNSAPNYGTDRGAFGERLGATAICNSTEDILSESVMAPLLREDPRYYRMGPGHNFFVRLIYAGTRPVITRTNGGRTTPNFALIAGNAEGSALANLYYPPVNRGMTGTMANLGLSIGGSAIGDVLGEFYGDVRQLLHHGRP